MIRNKIAPICVLLFWLVSGIYFGVGGLVRANLDENLSSLDNDREALMAEEIDVTYDGLEFTDKYSLQSYIEVNSIEVFFPWAIKISSFISLIITSLAFGLLGAIISLIKSVAFESASLETLKIWSIPTLGILTGLVVLGLSYLLPTILVTNGSGLKPITLMFLCLFAGMYSKQFYAKISSNFNKIFT